MSSNKFYIFVSFLHQIGQESLPYLKFLKNLLIGYWRRHNIQRQSYAATCLHQQLCSIVLKANPCLIVLFTWNSLTVSFLGACRYGSSELRPRAWPLVGKILPSPLLLRLSAYAHESPALPVLEVFFLILGHKFKVGNGCNYNVFV